MQINNTNENQPPGFRLVRRLRGHGSKVTQFAWSPDGKYLASSSFEDSIKIWNVGTGKLRRTIGGGATIIHGVAWSPDGQKLATASDNGIVKVWSPETGILQHYFTGHGSNIYSIAWANDSKMLASGGLDTTVRLWDTESGRPSRILREHRSHITCVAWSPDGRELASSSDDSRVRLWNLKDGRSRVLRHPRAVSCVAWSPDGKWLAVGSADHIITIWDAHECQPLRNLEGHTQRISAVSFSSDGRFLASKTNFGARLRIWRCDLWENVADVDESASEYFPSPLSFHPHKPILATLGSNKTEIFIRELVVDNLLGASTESSSHYANAKIVLVGDSGVGKSGLGLVLSGQPFAPTDSTHGRHVWTLESQEVKMDAHRRETRETLLWDLAGQPGYRLVHQLHLNEVAVALVVFDARNDIDPLAGVRHWDRALCLAQAVHGHTTPMKKFLVAARVDRGAIGISHARIHSLMQELGFDRYFETSARDGWQIGELTEAVRQAIDWETLPKVSSTELFQRMKEFLLEEKQAERLLSTSDDLYRAFVRSRNSPAETAELRAQFETCIGRLESRDLIQRLSFGGLVLLQPEMLDAYASAIVNAAKDEPDGLGCIAEDSVREGRFLISEDARIKDREQEKLLLIATVEDLLRHEIALREQTEHGPLLVFPSQLTRENPDLPDPEGKAVTFIFEGPLINIYATLAVRLSHSGIFRKSEMWKNAATYTASVGGSCGIFLRQIEEARGELTLFFDGNAIEETKFQFEEYVHTHLLRRALSESIHRRRVFVCIKCTTPITELQAKRRRERGFDWIECNVCDERVSLHDREERLSSIHSSVVLEMDRAADVRRAHETAALTLQGKIETQDFDVFLAYNSQDKLQVIAIAESLKQRGIYPWLDKEQIAPGHHFQDVIQKVIPKVKSAAVFISPKGLGKWEEVELRAFISQCVEKGIPVIPILLPGVDKPPNNLLFLKELNWVSFASGINDPEALDNLEWGITGVNPQRNFQVR